MIRSVRAIMIAAFATPMGGTGHAQELNDPKFTPYVDAGATRVEDKRDENPSVTDNRQVTLGLDVGVTRWLEIGGGVTLGEGDSDFGRGPIERVVGAANPSTSQIVDGSTDTDSWTIFGRATINLPSNVSFGLVAGYSETESEEQRQLELRSLATTTLAEQLWSRDSDTKFVSGSLSYTHRWDRWFAVPGIRLLYSDTHGGAYEVLTQIDSTDANNRQIANVAASDDDLLRGHLGADIGYFFVSGGTYIVPIFKAYWAHDFDLPDGFRDRDAVDLSASLNVIQGALTFGGEFQTTVGRDETETYGGRAYLLYKF